MTGRLFSEVWGMLMKKDLIASIISHKILAYHLLRNPQLKNLLISLALAENLLYNEYNPTLIEDDCISK